MMSDAQHALWVVPVADLGGVARHVLDATRVGVPGWSLTVLCPEGALAERLREQGSAVITGSFGPEAGMLFSKRTLERAARQLQPRIVHSHLAYADIIIAWSRLPRGTRRFTTEHGIAGDDTVYHRSGLHARVMATVHRLRFPKFDGVIAVSQATRDAMIAKWRVKQPIAVIHNGVDLPEGFERSGLWQDKAAPKVLSLSRLSPEKRIDKVLEAFVAVRRSAPDATLVIAGDGPLRAQLERQSKELGISEHTSFAGFVDPDRAMGDADVVVQLSIWENHSYTLLDAVCRGLGVVASDAGGNKEIVEPISAVDPETVASAILASSGRGPAYQPANSVAMMTRRISEQYARPRRAL